MSKTRRPSSTGSTAEDVKNEEAAVSGVLVDANKETTQHEAHEKDLEAVTPPANDGGDEHPEESRTTLQNVLIMFGLCLGLFLAAIDATIITTAVPTISAHFNSSIGYVWIGSAYTLGTASFVPTWGKISDIFGRKPVLLGAVVVFWIGSLLCALSTSIGMLIGARVIQGIGGGGLIVLPNICISDLFSMRNRGMYFGILGMVWALASSLGPILGGVFTSKVSWRWCFYVNLPISGVSLITLFFILKLHNPRTPVKEGLAAIDWVGSLLIIGGTAMFLVGLEFGGVTHPWDSATVLCLIIIGAATIGLFVFYEGKFAKYPVIPLRMFVHQNSIAAYSLAFCHAMAFMGGNYWLPLYFQGILKATPILSGVYFLPYSISLSLVSASVGVFIKKTGQYKIAICTGLLIMTLGYGLFIDLGAKVNWAKLIVFQIVAGIGVGPNFQAPLIALQTNIEPRDIGAATSCFTFLRQMGLTVSVAVGGVIFNNEMQKQGPMLQRELDPETAAILSGSSAAGSVNQVAALRGHEGEVARGAYWHSMRTMFIVYTCFAALGFFISVFIQQKKLQKNHQEFKTGLQSMKAEKDGSTTQEDEKTEAK